MIAILASPWTQDFGMPTVDVRSLQSSHALIHGSCQMEAGKEERFGRPGLPHASNKNKQELARLVLGNSLGLQASMELLLHPACISQKAVLSLLPDLRPPQTKIPEDQRAWKIEQ